MEFMVSHARAKSGRNFWITIECTLSLIAFQKREERERMLFYGESSLLGGGPKASSASSLAYLCHLEAHGISLHYAPYR